MKTTKTTLKLNWEEFDTNLFVAKLGNFIASVDGKLYRIEDLNELGMEQMCCPLFKAKARSVADALQRATNKLAKFVTNGV